MLGYLATNHQNISNNEFNRIKYLIGDFNVIIYKYQLNFWTKMANGRSVITSSDKLISEKIDIVNGSDVVIMNNTFGYEDTNIYKMLTLDLTSGSMDVYKGSIANNKLIFSNAQSNEQVVNGDENYTRFKLVYSQMSESENQVVIGKSEDAGKTWIPFIKSFYVRK